VVWKHFAVAGFVLLGMLAGPGDAKAQQDTSPLQGSRQSLDEAWWTGPMLAPNALTLPRGHFLIEPYFYDVISAHANGFGSLTYINYGLVDRVTVGLIPTAGYNVARGDTSSGIQIGDLTVQAQYRLTKFREGHWIPTTAIALQEALPTGKYDHLTRESDGMGSGALTTTVAFYSQTYFWMPNGRILRMRFNVVPAFSNDVDVRGASVYGTETGFLGKAKPGASIFLDAAWEYSWTRRWVLALDAVYRHKGNTCVTGHNILTGNVWVTYWASA